MKSRNFLFPYKNRTEGCGTTFKSQELHQHEDTCPRQNVCECATKKCEDRRCSWRGQRSEMWSHLEQTHPKDVFMSKYWICHKRLRSYWQFLVCVLDKSFGRVILVLH